MKIVLAAGLYPPDIGGPATYAQLLATKLPEHDITVTVVPYGAVRSLPKIARHVAYTYRLYEASRAADVIYALDPMSVGLPARVVARLRGLPFVVRLGGDYVWEQGVQRFGIKETLDEYTKNTATRPIVVRALAWLQTFVVRGARAVIVPSQYLGTVVGSWGIPKERIVVRYSAVESVSVPTDRTLLRHEFSFTEPTLISAGRLTPWKGFKALIDLIADRQRNQLSTTLVIAGDGPERQNLEAYAKEKQVETKVRFVGALSQDTLFAVIKAGDVFVLNTAYEGLSHQLLEVMAIGTPIITTPVGGNPELITDGKEGLLVPVDDVAAYNEAVTKLLGDSALIQRLALGARARAAVFSSTDAVSGIADTLKTVLR